MIARFLCDDLASTTARQLSSVRAPPARGLCNPVCATSLLCWAIRRMAKFATRRVARQQGPTNELEERGANVRCSTSIVILQQTRSILIRLKCSYAPGIPL